MGSGTAAREGVNDGTCKSDSTPLTTLLINAGSIIGVGRFFRTSESTPDMILSRLGLEAEGNVRNVVATGIRVSEKACKPSESSLTRSPTMS